MHDYKHILTDIERVVNNNVNNATHADELTMQHWAHCTQSVVASSDVFTSSLWLKADLICLFTFIPSMHMCLLPWVLFSSFSPSTSCSTSSSSFSSSWRTPTTPWSSTPCATPLTGPSSPWMIACPTQFKSSCRRWALNQKISLDGLSLGRCSTTSHWNLKKISKNANQTINSFRFMQKDLQQFGPGPEKKWYHLRQNNDSVDALQTNCFGINIKL